MLLSFAISNFRSFREEQTLSTVASNRYDDHLDHLVDIPDDENKALPIAVLYGANGAGKSNLVRALAFVQRQVLSGSEPRQPIAWQPFLFGDDVKQPSSFTLLVRAGKHVFNYGFRLTSAMVTEEWLALVRNGKEIILFERASAPDGSVRIEPGEGLTGDGFGDHSKVVALTKVGVRANQLFLAGIRSSLEPAAYGPLMTEVLRWFELLRIVLPDADFLPLAEWIARDAAFADFAGRFLRDADTGVENLRVEAVEVGEATLGLPQDFLRELIEQTPPGGIRAGRVKGLGEIIAQRGEGMKIILRRLLTEHRNASGGTVPLPFHEEADGTQRLTHLLPALFQLQREPRVYVIDEIDRSLHPLLARKFVEFFLAACRGKPAQLIITTHETHFLDTELLRRDEYWFAENKAGATELYSLSDYRVRTDLKLDKGYLHGRFGAIPLLGRLDNELEAATHS